ncbi:hypothetical protein KJ359_000237 [Pestalotiopsis sp. 9143b]|nr:hypothetical protein KJ359_000237 [Pestalotiopsis sp. 9143b]
MEDYAPNDDELVIMTYRVFAFVLRSRKWAQLDLTHLRYDNRENRESIETAFNRLVLPNGHKEMVKALVTQHFNGKTGAPMVGVQPDLIRGKCDLGTTPAEVQTELEKNFSLASRWGCVLLLDEADVFLAQRERKDLTRNALVAIFLHILEYYTGILFLTTNRVGDFDEAFASRIHMSLHYPALNAEKTKKVFELNLDLIKERMKQQNLILTIDEDAILDFAEAHYKGHRYGRWNGRQIRNACQTALALAEFEAKQDAVFLRPKHFKKVQQAYLDFSRYLGETFGTFGDQRAHESQLRAEEPELTIESDFSVMRAEPSGQPSRLAPSPFRPTARQQPAPMQPNQAAYGAYQSMQPQGGQYSPSNQPPRTSQPQTGPGGHEQFGYQPQTWMAQPPMAQTQAQSPYQRQPTQMQPPYQQQGFVLQNQQQTTDSSLNANANTDM